MTLFKAKSGIEITPNIKNMLQNVPKEAWDQILKRAWDACCDGSLYNFSYDPWDGNHEQIRKEIEEDSVSDIIDLADF